MKRLITIGILLMMAMPVMMVHASVPGDLTGDGLVDVTDVSTLIDIVLGVAQPQEGSTADLNGDGLVDVTDVSLLIDVVLGKATLPDPVKTGYDYVWDMDALPEIHIAVPLDQWNHLLDLYDAYAGTKQYVMASSFAFVQDAETTVIDSVGIRLKGNTSRRRPEGNRGEYHTAGSTDWHHFHLGVNLRKYHKDEDHTIQGVRKFHLKWFKDDPCYVRELFCYNLFRAAGVWTAPLDNYCRLWLKVEGDPRETYYGVYEMIEPVDENYLKQRNDSTMFGTHKGNLWKCKYVGQPATLSQANNGDYWYDDDTDANHTYTLQTNTKRFENAKAQIIDFQLKLNGKDRESFYQWINQVCDVDLLLKTYAVNVAVGMWDDYWNNGNNYYLYFTTEDLYDYKVYFIPYDYDNTLGTSIPCGNQSDSGRQNPLQWGVESNKLIQRLMEYDDLKAKYVAYLKELVTGGNDLMYSTEAVARVKAWQQRIVDYVANDTGEDMAIEDRPANWGQHHEYRLMEMGPSNFFVVKAQSINALP